MCGQIPGGGGEKEEGPPLVATAAVRRPERRRGRTSTRRREDRPLLLPANRRVRHRSWTTTPPEAKRDARRDELERRRKERDAKRDARRDERDFVQRCLVPGVVLSEKEEARWAPLKAVREEYARQNVEYYHANREKILQRKHDGKKRKLE